MARITRSFTAQKADETLLMAYMVCPGCEVYNLGTGKGTSVLEMVAAFERASGKVLWFSCLFIILRVN